MFWACAKATLYDNVPKIRNFNLVSRRCRLAWNALHFDLPSRRFLTNETPTPLSCSKTLLPRVFHTLNFESKETMSKCLVS